MKTKIKVFLFASLLTLGAKATVITVDNGTGNIGQYTTIQDAITAANAADTIYVKGNLTPYDGFIITKSIVLIGAGTFSAKQNSFPTTIIGAILFSSNISNITIEGFKITVTMIFSSFSTGYRTALNNVMVRNNYFAVGSTNNSFTIHGLTNSTGLVFSSNIFEGPLFFIGVAVDNLNTVTIENNIIISTLSGLYAGNPAIRNNVFYNNTNAFTCSNSCLTSGTIANNIFYNSHPTNGTINCSFKNNITFNSSGTLYPTLDSAIDGNINNTNPQFINVGTTGGYISSYNFNVNNASPAHNSAFDGKDMGIYGGSAILSLSGETFNMPVIREMNIISTNIPANGNVNVKVRSTKARTN